MIPSYFKIEILAIQDEFVLSGRKGLNKWAHNSTKEAIKGKSRFMSRARTTASARLVHGCSKKKHIYIGSNKNVAASAGVNKEKR